MVGRGDRRRRLSVRVGLLQVESSWPVQVVVVVVIGMWRQAARHASVTVLVHAAVVLFVFGVFIRDCGGERKEGENRVKICFNA